MSLFDPLLDLQRWFTPEVVMSSLAVVFAALTLGFMWRERKERVSESYARVAVRIKKNHTDGWFSSAVSIKNRTDSEIHFDSVTIKRSWGFRLAKTRDQYVVDPIPETIGRTCPVGWGFGPAAAHDRILLFRPRRGAGEKSVKLVFRVSVNDASRRSIRIKVITNSINWSP